MGDVDGVYGEQLEHLSEIRRNVTTFPLFLFLGQSRGSDSCSTQITASSLTAPNGMFFQIRLSHARVANLNISLCLARKKTTEILSVWKLARTVFVKSL